jgi:hypothetical protein
MLLRQAVHETHIPDEVSFGYILSYGCSITKYVPLEIVDSGDHFSRTQSRPLLRDAFMLALVGAFSLLNLRTPRLGTCF